MIICDTCNKSKEETKYYFDGKDKRKSTCISCMRSGKKPEKDKKSTLKDPRRKDGEVDIILYKRGTSKRKAVYKGSQKPFFLQFAQLTYNHVKRNHSLTPEVVNLLLTLYPVTPFNKKEFLECRKLNEFKDTSIFNKLLNDGWIYEWRNGYFDLTDKCKELMSDIHKWVTGEKMIPEGIKESAMDLIRRIQRRSK